MNNTEQLYRELSNRLDNQLDILLTEKHTSLSDYKTVLIVEAISWIKFKIKYTLANKNLSQFTKKSFVLEYMRASNIAINYILST